MKYAREVIELMGAHPGRRFKVRNLVRSIAPHASPRARASIREGVRRVLLALEDTGQIGSTREEVAYGSDGEYWWKPQHEILANRHANRDNIGRGLAP